MVNLLPEVVDIGVTVDGLIEDLFARRGETQAGECALRDKL